MVAVSQNGPRKTEQQLQTISDAFLDARVFKLATVENDSSPARKNSSPSSTASKPQPWWQRDQQIGSRCPFSAQAQETAQSTGCQETKQRNLSINACLCHRRHKWSKTDGTKKSYSCKKTHRTSSHRKSNVEVHTDPRLRTLHCVVRQWRLRAHTPALQARDVHRRLSQLASTIGPPVLKFLPCNKSPPVLSLCSGTLHTRSPIAMTDLFSCRPHT